MKCIEEAIEEENLSTKTMNRTMIMTTVFDCAIQLILKQAIAVVVPEARSAIANVAQTDMRGGSSHDHDTFIVSYGGNKTFRPKKGTRIQTERNLRLPKK